MAGPCQAPGLGLLVADRERAGDLPGALVLDDQQRAAAPAVLVGLALVEPALGAVHPPTRLPGRRSVALELVQVGEPPGQDLAEALDVHHRQVALVAPLQAPTSSSSGARCARAAAPLHRDLPLLLRELADQVLELGVGELGEIGLGVHRGSSSVDDGGPA